MNYEQLQSLLTQAGELNISGNYDEAERQVKQVLAELEIASSSPESMKAENSPVQVEGVTQNDWVVTLHCSALLTLAESAQRKGDYDSSLAHAGTSLDLAVKHNLSQRIATAQNTIGAVYWNLSTYDRALEYYYKALATYEELEEKSGVATVTGNIGIVYQDLGTYDMALEYYHKALVAHEKLGNKSSFANVTGNIGLVFADLGTYDKALEYYHKAIDAFEELGHKSGVALVTGNIGNVYYSLGSYDHALEYYQKSLAAHEELGEKSSVALVMGNIGSLFAYKKYESYNAAKAEEYLLKSITISTEIGSKASQLNNYKSLAALYENEERWKEHSFYYKKYIEVEKEINIEEAKKQESIREQQKEIEIERTRATAEKNILNNILPEEITQRLIKGENPIADHFDCVSVLFMDIVDFTPLASSITAQQLVHLLNAIFSSADGVMREFGMEKIKTIGDAYMAVAGAPVVQEDHAHRAAQAALKLLEVMENLVVTFPENYGDRSWIESIPEIKVRIGLHCGPVAAGVVGENKFLYDLWGDAVNTASRMESHGEVGRIHISYDFRTAVETSNSASLFTIQFIERGEMDIKGKGIMNTFFLERVVL